jgi:hypothetical protein
MNYCEKHPKTLNFLLHPQITLVNPVQAIMCATWEIPWLNHPFHLFIRVFPGKAQKSIVCTSTTYLSERWNASQHGCKVLDASSSECPASNLDIQYRACLWYGLSSHNKPLGVSISWIQIQISTYHACTCICLCMCICGLNRPYHPLDWGNRFRDYMRLVRYLAFSTWRAFRTDPVYMTIGSSRRVD